MIADGVHVPAVTFGRKTGGQRAFCSGKRKRHGLNAQAVCSPAGELLWAAAPQPGATVDITAARRAGIAAMLVSIIGVFAGLGYVGRDEQVVTGRRKPRGRELTPASGPRCCPEHCTAMVKAVLALHYMEHDPFAVLRAA
jgi:hypothetical protein